MRVAYQKLQENIAEYILYMWQVEDVIRACNFDIDLLQNTIFSAMARSDKELMDIRHWYADLIAKMKLEGLEKKGHLNFLNEPIGELNFLHGSLLNLFGDEKYKLLYEKALPAINELRLKSNSPKSSDIEICLNGLYAKLMLKLQKKEISQETEQSFLDFTNVLAYLCVKYKDFKAGRMN